MKKYCIVIEVKPECLDDYIEYHKEIYDSPYRELIEVIKKSGVREEAIFIYKNLAIIYFEAEDLNKCYKFQGKFEVAKRWNELMAPLFVSSCEFTFNDFKNLSTLEKVFDLNE
jgi:L-rhamnose mutarotase